MPTVQWNLVPEFYHQYIRQVDAANLEEALAQHATALPRLLSNIASQQWDYRYAPGKWSLKEVVQHIIDTERIFCYRALAFARGETLSLPGFDENSYAAHSAADRRTKESLLEEFDAVQKATRLLFASFDAAQLSAVGTANNNRLYVEGIGYIIAGHCRHHLNMLSERYLQPAAAQHN